jgi:hypothetical protein
MKKQLGKKNKRVACGKKNDKTAACRADWIVSGCSAEN